MSTHNSPKVFDAAIIGAGISGLSARKLLHERGWNTLTLEKSRGSGGRIASRRGDAWIADLGAQFTAASDPRWKALIETQSTQLIALKIQEDDHFYRFAHQQGMSRFSRALFQAAGSIESVRFQSKVIRLTPTPENRVWSLTLESGEKFDAASVILTAPVPQAAELIQQSNLTLSENCHETIASLEFNPCLTVIAVLASPLPHSLPAIWKNPSSEFAGIFDQKRKGLQNQKSVVVLHASNETSRELWERDASIILSTLLEKLHALLAQQEVKIEVLESTLHRWRYCEPKKIYSEPFLNLSWAKSSKDHPPLILAGDAFGRSSVEGAFLSGAAAAEFLAGTRSLS